jgi:hypothetical protein
MSLPSRFTLSSTRDSSHGSFQKAHGPLAMATGALSMRNGRRSRRALRALWVGFLGGWLLGGAGLVGPASAEAQQVPPVGAPGDPRVGLRAGEQDAGEAISNLRLLSTRPRPAAFLNPENFGDGSFSNTDLAFQGDLVFVGNYHGIQIWNVADPSNPVLRVSIVCPGGQGDVSVFGSLLFMSVQEPRSRLDCGTDAAAGQVNPERFRGVRIFDISNLDSPVQVAAVQTCRGSHTHTLVRDLSRSDRIFVYNSGTSQPRPAEELAGCSPELDPEDPNSSYFSIDVIEVPLATPSEARIVRSPRIFSDATIGTIAGLWPGGDHGPGTQTSRITHQCHDITAYPEIGLAAGACSGNGILLDIRDPSNPTRVDEVIDTNFAYWHSATFNNDGTTILFTDEWGGGTQPRCRDSDPAEWGANAIFALVDGKMEFRGYYKLPAAQTETENCVAHNGSLIPVPGRDIKVQAWYQGGLSVFDFTDPARPFELAYFDRGPISATELITGGYWSTYWYNGLIYGAEIYRGLDIFELLPSAHLTANELEAARLVRFDEFNPQEQPRMTWPASFAVSRALLDQLERNRGLPAEQIAQLRNVLEQAEAVPDPAQRRQLLVGMARAVENVRNGAQDARRVGLLLNSIEALADAAR